MTTKEGALAQQEASKFIRVGVEYYKIVNIPSSIGKPKSVPRKWNLSELKRDYRNLVGFFDHIAKYDGFCNVPDFTGNYQREIENHYNLASPLSHIPQEGEFPYISKFLKHIFGTTKFGDDPRTLEVGLDYIQLKYLAPNQKLPNLCLVSKTRNNGKSTFQRLLAEIFQENATVIGNEEMGDVFNQDWITKSVICIDEGYIDRRVVLERIKTLSASTTVKTRWGYATREEIAFSGTFILSTNEEKSKILLDKEEGRFWVISPPEVEQEDDKLLSKMTKEIPFFLHSLKTRSIKNSQRTRYWFDPTLLNPFSLNPE